MPPAEGHTPLPTMRFSIITSVLYLALSSCGEMELPAIPADKEDAADSGASENGTAVAEVSELDEGVPPPSEALIVDALPMTCSIWRNHVVVLSVPIEGVTTSSEVLVTLLSLYDWANIPSALSEIIPTLAATVAQGYQEYDLADWRIPTAAEAKALKAAYSPAPVLEAGPGVVGFDSLNALLLSLDASELHLAEGTANARYLCEGATRTFSFAPNTSISAAGAKATNYRLRLVKRLRLNQKP